MTYELDRRQLLRSGGLAVLAGAIPMPAAAAFAQHAFDVVAWGLMLPEGPKAQPNGTILLCEGARGTLSRVYPDGRVEISANVGGCPNGIAVGPDGAVYVCNNGGYRFERREGRLVPLGPAPGRKPLIQRVDLRSGKIEELYTSTTAAPFSGPNDIVFDPSGNFWFSDFTGNALYWARPDGGEIRLVHRLDCPNGIALSPDHQTLYVVQTKPPRIAAFAIDGPGRLATDASGAVRSRLLVQETLPVRFDSMAVDAAGNLVVGTLDEGCLSVFAPDGRLLNRVHFPDSHVTNITFGGRDMRTAYVTLTTSGMLAAIRWPRPGLRLLYQ